MAKARFATVRNGQKFLWLVDPNSADVCGSAGCALAGYLKQSNQYREVLSVLVSGRIPPPAQPNNFVQTTRRIRQGLPCLKLLGINDSSNAEWCFNGKTYTFIRRL